MEKRGVLISLVLLFAFLSTSAYAAKRALVVGIGTYARGTEWATISSKNDVDLLCPALEHFGFTVTKLIDSQATHAGIINSLKALIKRARFGDQIYLHFSCHGQQMKSSSPKETDGLDEAMVPYDAKKECTASYRGQNHLRDKEFNIYLTKLRKKIGSKGMLFVSLDACHSGDAHRGFGEDDDEPDFVSLTERGTSEIFGEERGSSSSRRFSSVTKNFKSKVTQKTPKGLSQMVVISACQSFQVNREYIDRKNKKSYGSLTYLIWKELSTLKSKVIDFKAFGEKLLQQKGQTMSKRQKPYLVIEYL